MALDTTNEKGKPKTTQMPLEDESLGNMDEAEKEKALINSIYNIKIKRIESLCEANSLTNNVVCAPNKNGVLDPQTSFNPEYDNGEENQFFDNEDEDYDGFYIGDAAQLCETSIKQEDLDDDDQNVASQSGE